MSALDLRNHGRSPWTDSMSFDAMAGDVAAFIEARGLSRGRVLGHSLGGKVAMRLALTRPELVERLVVVDVAPVAYAHSFGPFLEAMRAVDLAAVQRRADADLQLQAAVADAAIRNFPAEPREDRCRLRLAGQSRGARRQHAGARRLSRARAGAAYHGPTLFIAGGRSPYIEAEHRPLIARLFPAAEHAVIEGAGHWVHAERPGRVPRAGAAVSG